MTCLVLSDTRGGRPGRPERGFGTGSDASPLALNCAIQRCAVGCCTPVNFTMSLTFRSPLYKAITAAMSSLVVLRLDGFLRPTGSWLLQTPLDSTPKDARLPQSAAKSATLKLMAALREAMYGQTVSVAVQRIVAKCRPT